MQIITRLDLLDHILMPYQSHIGKEYEGYKNHVLRMLNFCFYLADPDDEAQEKLIIAGAFHDLGIWTAQTIDYLPPSVQLARHWLQENKRAEWQEEIELIISEHHKIRQDHHHQYPMVEIFRQADLVDFSLGLVKHGVPKPFISSVQQALPNAGFHRFLIKLTANQVVSHPFSNPAPMMKW